jgi:arsenate reductase
MTKKALFICVHNSARSQMAEAWLNFLCPKQFEAHSAGLEPGALNPLAVEAMREIGVDISGKKTQSVFDVFKSGQFFPYVITVCDERRTLSNISRRHQAIALELSRPGCADRKRSGATRWRA